MQLIPTKPNFLKLALVGSLLVLFLCSYSLPFAQTLTAISRLSQNALGNGQLGQVGRPSISPNGTLTAFSSTAGNLVAGDFNNARDIFLRNLKTGVVSRLNLGPLSEEADGDSTNPSLSATSPNGFVVVAFESDATNIARSRALLPDTNGVQDIFFSLPRASNITERISIGPNGVESDGRSSDPTVTIVPLPNRMLISYRSSATNLVEDDTNGFPDVFLATVLPGTDSDPFTPATHISNVRVSVAADPAAESDGASGAPQVSGDGRFVVYDSFATNLVSGVTPDTRQIYLYDVAKKTNTLISKSSSGTPGNNDSFNPSINYRGSFIVYLTASTNIVEDGFAPDENTLQVMLYNTATGETTRANTSSAGVPGNGTSVANLSAVVSANGRFVMFTDSADNLVDSDTNGLVDVFTKDMLTGETSRISTASDGSEGDGGSVFASFGQSGFVTRSALAVFNSNSTNLVAGDSEGNPDVFLASLTYSPPPLTKNTVLEVPPDVSTSSKSLSITMEKFSGVSLSSAKRKGTLAATEAAKVKYEVKYYRETSNGKKKELTRKIQKRNTLAVKGLTSGTYVVQYRTRIVRGERTVSRTRFSPSQRVSVS